MAVSLTLFLLLVSKIFQVNHSSIPEECDSPRILQSDMPAEAIPPFLLVPFCNGKELLRRAYGLKKFPRQTIHTTGALLHAIIALAGASNVCEPFSEPDGGHILTIDLLLANNLRK
jgi:hypothetical protein